jgi:hypothetical protein
VQEGSFSPKVGVESHKKKCLLGPFLVLKLFNLEECIAARPRYTIFGLSFFLNWASFSSSTNRNYYVKVKVYFYYLEIIFSCIVYL